MNSFDISYWIDTINTLISRDVFASNWISYSRVVSSDVESIETEDEDDIFYANQV